MNLKNTEMSGTPADSGVPDIYPVPYLPSFGVYKEWMRLRLTGCSDGEAWRIILSSTPRNLRRRMARTIVAGAHGQAPLLLSVPVIGGGSLLKRGQPEEWRVSMHGRWQAMHLGALAAAYSATPFYPYLEPEIRRVIEEAEEGDLFLDITCSLHRIVTRFIDADALIPELRRRAEADYEWLRQLAVEKSNGLHTDLTVLDVIFKKGPEGIFALI